VREMREQSRAKLPGTNMAQEQHERLLLPETMFDVFKVFQAHPLENFFRRHASELHATEQVRSQLFKMSAHDPAHLFLGKFVPESDMDIAQSQLSVVRQD